MQVTVIVCNGVTVNRIDYFSNDRHPHKPTASLSPSLSLSLPLSLPPSLSPSLSLSLSLSPHTHKQLVPSLDLWSKRAWATPPPWPMLVAMEWEKGDRGTGGGDVAFNHYWSNPELAPFGLCTGQILTWLY